MWEADVTDRIEADDAVSIRQYAINEKLNDESVICSIDKDLKMVPGHHYNFVEGTWEFVTPVDGLRHFYAQLLAGDGTDDIPGIYGIGLVRGKKMLAELNTEEDMWDLARTKLEEAGFLPDEILTNARLLWMMRTHDDVWGPPVPFEL